MDNTTLAVIDTPTPDISRHQRLCAICSHPEREAIEEAFLHWHSTFTIVVEFGLGSRSTIFRHAHALGLFEKRRRNLRFALEHIIETAEIAVPSPPDVIRAVQTYTRVNDKGEWIDPVQRIIVSRAETNSNRNSAKNRKRRK